MKSAASDPGLLIDTPVGREAGTAGIKHRFHTHRNGLTPAHNHLHFLSRGPLLGYLNFFFFFLKK